MIAKAANAMFGKAITAGVSQVAVFRTVQFAGVIAAAGGWWFYSGSGLYRVASGVMTALLVLVTWPIAFKRTAPVKALPDEVNGFLNGVCWLMLAGIAFDVMFASVWTGVLYAGFLVWVTAFFVPVPESVTGSTVEGVPVL